MKNIFWAILFYVLTAVILLPGLVSLLCHTQNHRKTTSKEQEIVEVFHPEIISSNNTLETYLKGVVAAEMPALFPEEALKAQAVAARTYTIHSLSPTKKVEIVPDQIGQAYLSIDQLKQQWGENFTPYYQKISDAVDATYGEIMVYDEEPILAVFHAESSGKTETAENVWEQSIPYLKSVDSSVDEKAPNFQAETTLSCDEIVRAFTQKFGNLGLCADQLNTQIKILSRSPSGYILNIQVGNKTLTGKQVRETLGLRSTNFTLSFPDSSHFCFTTKGYGHGAGMSQYGASFMAEDGKNYHEILEHYYTGIQFEKWDKINLFSE